ncbi:MAG TPA: sigma-70 family RNA polymerase sigma factor [Terriglobia bacterium]
MTPEPQASDGDLLRSMIAGDEHAFVALYRRRQGAIYRFALQMTGNPGLAEEITQEVFMTLIREMKAFDPARGTLGGFLYGICRNHVLRYVAEESPYVGFPETSSEGGNGFTEPAALSDLLSDLAEAETVERVRRAVLTLPPHHREAVVLCDLHEMSYEQAAGVLGCPVGTVRSRLHRARELLLAKLKRVAAAPTARADSAPRHIERSL